MPFVRKADSQGSQPPTDTRKLFIGRTGELLFFVQNILKPEEPTHNIISIWGQGGVGKSTLLARFIDEAHSANYKDYCLIALVDERQITPASIMEKFADQLHISGDFEKALRQYKEALRKLQADDASHRGAIEQVLNAYENTEYTREIIRVLRKLVQEQANNQLSSSAQHSIELLLRYIEADPPIQSQWQESVEAADALLKTAASHPSFSQEQQAQIYRKRGFAYKRLKEYERAITDYNRAIELDSNYARAYASRGDAYRNIREYEQSIEDYNRALELRSNYAWAYVGRGQTHSLRKEYGQALKDLNHATEIAPNYTWAYFVRGYTHPRLKDIVHARIDFIQSLELNPKNVERRWMVEWTGMCLERPENEIIERLEAIASVDPENGWALVCRGVALWLRKHFEDALTLLDQAILLKPGASDPYFWKGMAYAFLGREEKAIAAVEGSLELELPPILLTSLRWFEQDRPDFYQKYVVPLMARYDLE